MFLLLQGRKRRTIVDTGLVRRKQQADALEHKLSRIIYKIQTKHTRYYREKITEKGSI